MNNILKRIKKDVSIELLNMLWPGFKRAAFALYNDEHVYVFHHPLFLKDDGEYTVLKRMTNLRVIHLFYSKIIRLPL